MVTSEKHRGYVLKRLLRVAAELQRRGRAANGDIALNTGMCRRSSLRYIKALEEHGCLRSEGSNGKRVYVWLGWPEIEVDPPCGTNHLPGASDE